MKYFSIFLRFLCFFSLFLISLLLGFLFAGVLGALFFGILNTAAWMILFKEQRDQFFKKSLIRFLLLSIIGYFMMLGTGLIGANALVHEKIKDIKNELISEGYKPRWFIISQKRYSFYNELLKNSVKKGKSRHLKGKAIDLFIFDINDDKKYDMEDFELIKKAEANCEKTNPKINGRVYNYFGRGSFTQHMIHVEID